MSARSADFMSAVPPSDTLKAARLRRVATRREATAADYAKNGDTDLASETVETAAALHLEVDDLLRLDSPPIVRGGEVVRDDAENTSKQQIADTLANPSKITVDASIARTDLLVGHHADMVAIAVDAAQSIGARNSLEKMLAHQLAALHSVAMRTMDRASIAKPEHQAGILNSAIRAMTAFQGGLHTLQRLRADGSQTVTVRHVTVEAGGQAVIGNVEAGGKSKNGR